MTKYPMTKETRMTNDEVSIRAFVARHLPIRPSSFVIPSSLGHSSFVIVQLDQ
jgi:hypothetical protein